MTERPQTSLFDLPQNVNLPVNRLDTDPNSGLCRLAFHGRVLWMASNKEREKVAGELISLLYFFIFLTLIFVMKSVE